MVKMSGFAQLLAGAMDAAFYGTHGELEHVCDFLVLIAFYKQFKGVGVDGLELIHKSFKLTYYE